MPLAGAGQPCGEADIVKAATVVFEEDRCFKTINTGIAIAEQELGMAIVVDIAHRAAHRTPAAGDAELGSDVGEGAIAIVVPDPRRRATGRAMPCTERVDGVLGA